MYITYMSTLSSLIYVGWPIPTGLKVIINKSGPVGHSATFSWDKILSEDMEALDPSGGGYSDISWRVMINTKSYIVKNNPIFTIGVPVGCGETCVRVQAIYDLSSVEYEFEDLATSEYCDKVCIKNDRDKYCENPNINNNVKTTNSGSARMRYARAINGGAAAFR